MTGHETNLQLFTVTWAVLALKLIYVVFQSLNLIRQQCG